MHWLRWLEARVQRAVSLIRPATEEERYKLRLWVFRILAVISLILAANYILWRYAVTLNLRALWFAIPVVLAETYGVVDLCLFAFALWKPARRVAPPPIEGATVDVYITTYNEPVELIRLTADAAMRIAWPNMQVYILDDGARPAMEAMAQGLGCGYITRGEEWTARPRHAKAGNVDNALLQTSGEFILILDGDQIPDPRIVARCIGYFRDPKVAFVQTPQYFYNLPPGDPFGSNAALFYGPIQQGKDGWNAAFFCGSNAILRREALMQLGLAGYVQEMERRIRRGVSNIEQSLHRLQAATSSQRAALTLLREALDRARHALQAGEPLQRVSDIVRQAVASAQQVAVRHNAMAVAQDQPEISDSQSQVTAQLSHSMPEQLSELEKAITDSDALGLGTVGLPPEAMGDLDLTRGDEAIPVLGLPTYSVTEDMAAAMRLHAMGWRSVFHPEILAYGLAPEDLGSALRQRLRWAQGTMQIMLRENPFLIKGLSFAQRVQYFTTMYSYLSGFSNLVFLLCPIVYLFTGIAPVSTLSIAFLARLVPYLVIARVTSWYVTRGLSVHRGEQYAVALFPIWIQAIVGVVTGIKPRFIVTPKERQAGVYLKLVWPQLLIVCATALAIVYALILLVLGGNRWVGATLAGVFWGCYNIAALSAIIRAAMYKPRAGWEARPPRFLFPDGDSVN